MNKRILIIAGIVFVILVIFASLAIMRRPRSVSRESSGDKKAKSLFSFTSASALYREAREMENKKKFYEAKSLYQKLVAEFSNSAEVMNWQKKLEELNIKLLFSPTPTPKSTIYEIKPGDTLTKIAKAFKTTVELIQKANGIEGDKIMPGEKIKIWTSPFTISIDKSQNILILKSDEEIIKAYVVATGTNNSTPIGKFKIVNKIVNPTWFKAGAVVAPDSPENILGSRWMGINMVGYGIHGTTDPKSVGKQITQGCVRMVNSDVEELYSIVPVGSEVIIVD
jgi:lipoprotein-anchoring transpeptidase ErfK/SrfK